MRKKLNALDKLSVALREKIKKAPQPSFVQPMLATLTTDYFSSDDWIYEHKFDGVRCFAFKKGNIVTLKSRNDKIMNEQYPELVQDLKKQKTSHFIIDGEIVALGRNGVSDFQLLQGRINLRVESKLQEREHVIKVFYRIFDVLYADGYDVRALPLLVRKEILLHLLQYTHTLTYTEHIVGKGVPLFHKACKAHWEGLIAKRSESPYVGVRSRDWLKFKCVKAQELVIGGYTLPRGSRAYFGALLVGYYKAGKLLYAGKVGTGFTQETLELLGRKMKKLETKKCPFVDYDKSLREVTWIRPILVAEFKFAEWTRAGRLRVGRYKGLRTDKKAKDVIREVPK